MLVVKLGVRYGEGHVPKGLVLASLRASRATQIFEETGGDLTYTAWRLRVKSVETLRCFKHQDKTNENSSN